MQLAALEKGDTIRLW